MSENETSTFDMFGDVPMVAEPANGQVKEKVYRFVQTEERLNTMKLGLVRKAQKGDVDAMCRFLAHFLTIDGKYVPYSVAIDYIDELTIGQMNDTVNGIMKAAEDTAAPKA